MTKQPRMERQWDLKVIVVLRVTGDSLAPQVTMASLDSLAFPDPQGLLDPTASEELEERLLRWLTDTRRNLVAEACLFPDPWDRWDPVALPGPLVRADPQDSMAPLVSLERLEQLAPWVPVAPLAPRERTARMASLANLVAPVSADLLVPRVAEDSPEPLDFLELRDTEDTVV